ncbi:two component sensor histidine kinase FecR/PupR [Acetobacter syzygii NRIC 0483]|nr:two component sensor histidine kinase FecR/PupR [Acetobacter syzygii NRIC 0483]
MLMATPPDPTRARAEKDATNWLILLQEEPDDPSVQADFQAWRAASPVNDDVWRHTQKAMGIVAALPAGNTGNWQADHKVAAGATKHRFPVFQSRRRTLVAGVMALAACAALVVFLPDITLRLRADAMTGTAERVTLTLPDGGTITLAPSSAVTFGPGGDRRHVTLLAGEALFSVVHDEKRPFLVRAGAFETEDIGTLFDVSRQGEGLTVAVKAGQVRVRGGKLPPQGVDLSAGQMITADAATFHTTERPADQMSAWADGFVLANDEPLGRVIERLRPWLQTRVIIAPSLARQPVSGAYSLADPDAALQAIAQARQANIRRLGPWVTVLY